MFEFETYGPISGWSGLGFGARGDEEPVCQTLEEHLATLGPWLPSGWAWRDNWRVDPRGGAGPGDECADQAGW